MKIQKDTRSTEELKREIAEREHWIELFETGIEERYRALTINKEQVAWLKKKLKSKKEG